MSETDLFSQMRTRLNKALSPSHLEIIDEGDEHLGHFKMHHGNAHLALQISSAAFQGKNLVACHRLIYDALGDLMQTEIHALRIEIIKE